MAQSSGIDKGTSFIVEPPSFEHELLDAAAAAMCSEPEPLSQDLLSGVHALIVEDDPDGCELLETVLVHFGATVTTANTARAALEALEVRRPDVLVSDIGLPDEDGLALIRRLRQRSEYALLPAVALTAYASQRDVDQAIAAGFHAHVAKPVLPKELGEAIARVSGK